MIDPSVIPWNVVWYGLVIAAGGMVLALHANEQRQSNQIASLGMAGIALGILLMVGTPLINGSIMLFHAFGQVAQEAVASANARDNAYRQR